MDSSTCQKINLNFLYGIKIAWVRNWERKWLPYLKLFDFVFCCNDKAKKFFESNKIISNILPIGANFDNLNFNKKILHDIYVDCNLFNRRKIVDMILRLKKETKYKIKICGKNWDKFLLKAEFQLIKDCYHNFIQPENIKEEYLSSKIIIDDCNINTIEFGSVNKRVVDCISCKRLVLTNNLVGSKELFDNKLLTYDSYDELKKLIDYYLSDNEKYESIVNNLYNKGKNIVCNKNNVNFLFSIINFNPNNLKYFFINLNRRKDRLGFMNYKLKKLNIDATRIEAIDGYNQFYIELYNKLFKNSPWYIGIINSPGAIGLIETWKKL